MFVNVFKVANKQEVLKVNLWKKTRREDLSWQGSRSAFVIHIKYLENQP